MRCCWLLGVLLANLAGAAPAPPRVAFMYSDWPKGAAAFKNEFDSAFKELGWTATKFENIEAADLTARLGEFDMVVGGGVSNLDHAVNFEPYAAAWQEFLNRGGVVIATDASYAPINQQWLGAIDPALKTSSATCSAHSQTSIETERVHYTPGDPLLNLPHRLAGELAGKTCWAHLTDVPEGWTAAVTCYDGQPLLIHRRYGRGLVIVSSYFRFTGLPLGTHLLENAWTMASLQRAGLAVDGYRLPEAPRLGTNRLGLTLTSLGDPTPVTLQLALQGAGQDLAREQTATVGATPTPLDIAVDLPARAAYEGSLTLQRGGETLLQVSSPMVVPELLAAGLGRRHLFNPRSDLLLDLQLAPELQERLAQLRVVITAPGAAPLTLTPADLALRQVVTLDNPPVGAQQATVDLREGDTSLQQVALPFEVHPRPRIWFDEKNVCHIGDEPFFPIGMYHVAWRATREEMLQALDDMAVFGCNVLHSSCTDPDVYQELLDEAARRGVMVISEGVSGRPEVLERFRDHPAVLAWNSGDEPDLNGTTPAQVGQRIDAVLDHDPEHPLYTVVANPAVLHRYAPYAEVFANDPYPLHKPDSDTIAVSKQTALARESVEGRRPIWMVPQCFGYPNSTWAIPNADQLRSMTYQALIEGANGIIWYVYDDVRFKLNYNTELLVAISRLVTELRKLTPLFLGPSYDAERAAFGPDDCLRTVAIREGGTTTILAAHTNAQNLGEQTLALPGLPANGTVEVLFEGRTVAVENGQLTDTFRPYGVHVYRVKP